MSESGIVTKILAAARTQGEKVLEEAKRKREQALTAGLEELGRELASRLESEKKHLREKLQQDLSASRLVEKNKTRKLQRNLLDGIYEEAWGKALEPARYRKYVEKQLSEHCRPGDTIIAPAQQGELFRKELAALLSRHKLTLAEEQGKFRAGFVIVGEDIRLNCSLDEAMKRAVAESEIEISRLLFGT